jgi:phosphate transport system substrate-binding protein
MALLGLFAALAGGSGLGAAEAIRVNGSGSALALMKPLVAAYQKANPGVAVDMAKPLGSSGAMKALLAGALDFAVTSKPLAPEDAAQGAQLRPYGRTPLAIITGPRVDRTDITTADLTAIYAGELKAWPGGEPVRLVLRPEGDVDTRILRELAPGMQAAMALAQKREGMIVAVTDPEANEAVARTPGGIGASGLCGLLVDPVKVEVLSLDGVRPTTKALASGAYPLAKEIGLVTTGRASPAALRLLDFICSPKGKAIAAKAGVLVR